MFFLTGAGGSPTGFYQIDRSLRFNSADSAYLSRTPGSASNRRTFTYSGWVKRCGFLQSVIDVPLLSAGDGTNFGISGTGGLGASYDGRFYFRNGGSNLGLVDIQLRDPSAWYHFVVAVDTENATSSDRQILYVNGVRQPNFSGTFSLNADTNINTATIHTIGMGVVTTSNASYCGNFYLAEVHFIDGTALDPTSFGEFDENGVWRPINVTGLTYGTNGFYLSFADNTSTTTLGYDDAGSNDWTLNNFSVAAGAGNDSLEDTPTNNFCTLNPIDKNSNIVLSNGNLTAIPSSTADYWLARATMAMPVSGKWYWELLLNNTPLIYQAGIYSNNRPNSGATSATGSEYQVLWGSGVSYIQFQSNSAAFANWGTNTNPTSGDILMFAVDADNGTMWVGRNGTWYNTAGTANPATNTDPRFSSLPAGLFPGVNLPNPASGGVSMNFGQRPFAYTPPTGFQALCTANLPTPDIADPGSYMNAVTYTGTGSSQSITGVGFQPDLVWIKGRSGATDHALYDAVRGVQNQLESNTTTDETTEATGLTAFGSDGFTVGALAQVNTSSATYVGWCWREGVTPGFDIVTYTGTGVARTISHNLGTVPKLIIVKARSTASTDQGWPVYHASNTAAPETDYLLLNSTAATADLDTVWNDTAPTTTVFSVGTNALVNALNDTYVAYLFAEVDGFSKFGSYTGNGSADGPFVWCGFRPRFILYKNSSGAGNNWLMHDAARNPNNLTNNSVAANASNAENDAVISGSTENTADFLSNGFKLRSINGQNNGSGSTIIFAAFAEQPFSAPANAR